MIVKKSVLHYILFDGKDKTLFYTKQVFLIISYTPLKNRQYIITYKIKESF